MKSNNELKVGDICFLANKRAPIWDQYEDKNIGIIVSDVDKGYGKYVLLNKGRYVSYYRNLLRKVD